MRSAAICDRKLLKTSDFESHGTLKGTLKDNRPDLVTLLVSWNDPMKKIDLTFAFLVVLALASAGAAAAQLEPSATADVGIQGMDVLITAVRFGAVLALSSFMAITARSFLRSRLRKKEAEYNRLLELLGIDSENERLLSVTVKDEYRASDYVLPVSFATIACVVGFTVLVFGNEMLDRGYGQSALASGPMVIKLGTEGPASEELIAFRRRSFMVVGFAFIGAFLWSAQNITRRLISADLRPGTYYDATLRIILSGMTALVLSWMLGGLGELSDAALPSLAFLAGMTPEQALRYLRERSRIFAKKSGQRADALELEMLEGVNLFHQVRLSEVGVDNAQNLAESNLISLLLKTPFPPRVLIDWIAQAKLYVAVKDDLEPLRRLGVRTAFDLRRAGRDGNSLAEIAREVEISELKLRLICNVFDADAEVERLEKLQALFGSFGALESVPSLRDAAIRVPS
jgi:hypothetical protein